MQTHKMFRRNGETSVQSWYFFQNRRRRKWKWSVSFVWVFLLQESLRLRFPMSVSVVLRRYSVCEAIQTPGTQDNTLAQRNALSHSCLKWTSSCDNSNLIIFSRPDNKSCTIIFFISHRTLQEQLINWSHNQFRLKIIVTLKQRKQWLAFHLNN